MAASATDWREILDSVILGYLRKEPRTPYEVQAWAELHTQEDVYASLQRLKAAGKIAEVHGGGKGAVWAVLYEGSS